jgi:hypothetical protein
MVYLEKALYTLNFKAVPAPQQHTRLVRAKRVVS